MTTGVTGLPPEMTQVDTDLPSELTTGDIELPGEMTTGDARILSKSPEDQTGRKKRLETPEEP